MKRYTVHELARLSGLTVRALHHYDEIGLLKPAFIGENRYRYYGRDELLRLQQILFHRELGLPLHEIAALLDEPGFDRIAALKQHRARLQAEAKRYRQLVKTIDRTIADLEGDSAMDSAELYKGFSAEKQAQYEDWLVQQQGDEARRHIEAGHAAMGAWSAVDREAFMRELAEIERGFVQAMEQGLAPEDAALAPLLRRHHAWVARTWAKPPSAEAYGGLGELYAAHPDFRVRYETLKPGLADWLARAMRAFALSL